MTERAQSAVLSKCFSYFANRNKLNSNTSYVKVYLVCAALFLKPCSRGRWNHGKLNFRKFFPLYHEVNWNSLLTKFGLGHSSNNSNNTILRKENFNIFITILLMLILQKGLDRISFKCFCLIALQKPSLSFKFPLPPSPPRR